MTFTNKVILITGGSSGIGKATVILFAQNGANVALTYKSNKRGAEGVVGEINKLGRGAVAVQADLLNENEAKNAIEEVIKKFGKIDVLVNNAGRYVDGDEWNGTSDIWLKSLQQNLISVMNVSKYVAEVFHKQKSGIMVNVASRHGINGVPDAISYSASKAGIINVTQSYAKLLSPFGRANSISPSAANAGYWLTAPKEEIEELLASMPSHKLIDPKIIAKKILYLASDEAEDINGRNFPISE